jgi:hypothetical protein
MFPVAEDILERTCSLPMYAQITDKEIMSCNLYRQHWYMSKQGSELNGKNCNYAPTQLSVLDWALQF